WSRRSPPRAGSRSLPASVRPGEAGPCEAQPRIGSPGAACPGTVRPGVSRPGEARPGEARPREARPREARPRVAGPAIGGPDGAGPGVAVPRAVDPRRLGLFLVGQGVGVDVGAEDVAVAGERDAVERDDGCAAAPVERAATVRRVEPLPRPGRGISRGFGEIDLPVALL